MYRVAVKYGLNCIHTGQNSPYSTATYQMGRPKWPSPPDAHLPYLPFTDLPSLCGPIADHPCDNAPDEKGNPMESTDVLVIGSGIAGLCAAIEAARTGATVAVASAGKTMSGSELLPWNLGPRAYRTR